MTVPLLIFLVLLPTGAVTLALWVTFASWMRYKNLVLVAP